MENLISVIIPAYNAQKTIERCINSINGNVEIIVVIDGSTDNTLSICQKIKKDGLKIIKQTNKGVLEARNTGIQNAHGKYLMFLDSDDCFKSNTIQEIEELISKYDEPDLIRFRYEKEPNGYEQYKYFEEDEKVIKKQLFSKYVYPMFIEGYMLNAIWLNCVKREKVKILKSNVKYGEDLLLNLEIFSNIENVIFTNKILYRYIYEESSETNSRNINILLKHMEDAVEVYSSLYEYIEKWQMNTFENVQKVRNRVKKEVNQLIKLLKENT